MSEKYGVTNTSNIPKFVKELQFATENQAKFYDKIIDNKNNIVMCHAVAGVGKTHVSLHAGLQLMFRKNSPIKRILVINPTVDVGREDPIGFIPGSLDSKIGMYNDSAYNVLCKLMTKAQVDTLIEKEKLQFKALNFLRGANLEDSFIVMDEAQNASPGQLKTLMTRINDTSKLIIQGDLSQCDKYHDYRKSGFHDVWKRLSEVKGIDKIEFDPDDVIRSEIVKRILEKYWDDDKIILNGFKD